MIEIKDLLGRFDKILLGEEGKKQSIRNIISEVIGVQIKNEDIEIRNSVIYLNIKPIYKNEIFMRREEIFKKLDDSFGKKSPTAVL